MNRDKKMTKREKRALAPPRPAPIPKPKPPAATAPSSRSQSQEPAHIHCVACGRHIEPKELKAPASALIIQCEHKSQFAACVQCLAKATELLEAHDRSGQPVQAARAWH